MREYARCGRCSLCFPPRLLISGFCPACHRRRQETVPEPLPPLFATYEQELSR